MSGKQPYYGILDLKEKYNSAVVRAWFRANPGYDQPASSGTVSEYHYLLFFENNPAVRNEPERGEMIRYLRSQPRVVDRIGMQLTSTVDTSTGASSSSASASTSGMWFPSTTSDSRSASGQFFGTPSSAPAIPVQQNEQDVQVANLIIEQVKKVTDLDEMLKRKTITMQDVNVARQRIDEINKLLGRITYNRNNQRLHDAFVQLNKNIEQVQNAIVRREQIIRSEEEKAKENERKIKEKAEADRQRLLDTQKANLQKAREAEENRAKELELQRIRNDPRHAAALAFLITEYKTIESLKQREFVNDDGIVTQDGYETYATIVQARMRLQQQQEADRRVDEMNERLKTEAADALKGVKESKEQERARKRREAAEQRERERLQRLAEASQLPTPNTTLDESSILQIIDTSGTNILDGNLPEFASGPPRRPPPENQSMSEIRDAIRQNVRTYNFDEYTELVQNENLNDLEFLLKIFGHRKILKVIHSLIFPALYNDEGNIVNREMFMQNLRQLVQFFRHRAFHVDFDEKPHQRIFNSFAQFVLDHNTDIIRDLDLQDELLDEEFIKNFKSRFFNYTAYYEYEPRQEDNLENLDFTNLSGETIQDLSQVDETYVDDQNYTQQQTLNSSDVPTGSTQPPVVQTTEDFIEISFYPDLVNAGDQYDINDIITAQFTGRDLLFIAKSVKAQMGFV